MISSTPLSIFNLSEELLNKALGDYVVSIIPSFDAWNQTANVTRFPTENYYDFSGPKLVYLSYGIILLLALPIMFLGNRSLPRNGVPATDGGFLQILNTVTGSLKLRIETAKNCLGGGNVSKDLMRMKIKFGELKHLRQHHAGEMVRRAGFGVMEELEGV